MVTLSVPWALTFVFIILKAVGVISWSWWLVFSPVLLVAGLFIVFSVVAMILAFVIDNQKN